MTQRNTRPIARRTYLRKAADSLSWGVVLGKGKVPGPPVNEPLHADWSQQTRRPPAHQTAELVRDEKRKSTRSA